MNRTCLQAAVLAALLFLPAVVPAHGTRGITEDYSGVVCAKASYDDKSPISYARAEIFSPADEKLPFQTGRTDRNGFFCFQPDTPGDWKVTIKDEMGHMVRLNPHVSADMIVK